MIPTFFICSLKIQKTILNICNWAQRQCIWAKEEDSSSIHAQATWETLCPEFRDSEQGAAAETTTQILLKGKHPWVNLFWSLYGNSVPHAQTHRVSFWWRDIFSLVGEYRSISCSQVASGTSIIFWKDIWSEGALLYDKYPRLYSYALYEDLSMADLATVEDLSTCLPYLYQSKHTKNFSRFHNFCQRLHL
jgi:hypothetical protein